MAHGGRSFYGLGLFGLALCSGSQSQAKVKQKEVGCGVGCFFHEGFREIFSCGIGRSPVEMLHLSSDWRDGRNKWDVPGFGGAGYVP